MAPSKPQERQKVYNQILSAAGFSTVVFIAGYFVLPFPLPSMPERVDRVLYTIQWQMVSALTLWAGIQAVGAKRLVTTAIDPINGRGEHQVIVDARYLQNTLEQFILSTCGQIVLSTYLQEHQMKAIPVLVFLFVTGRLLFWIGYHRHSLQRGFGFALTFLPTVFTYFVCIYYFLSSGPISRLYK